MQIPPPTDWKEFEEITLTCLKIKWSSPNLSRHGRQGQPQVGVDVYGEDDLGRFTGIQCKLVSEKLNLSVVRKEVAKAETFEPKLSTFFIATTANSDVKLQREIRLLSSERVKQNDFPVGIFFWEDLIQELVKNRDAFHTHYPDFSLSDLPPQARGARFLSIFDMSFYGPSLANYLDLLFNEITFVMTDPYEFGAILNIVDTCTALVFDSKSYESLQSKISPLMQHVLTALQGNMSWNIVSSEAKQIEWQIYDFHHKLVGKELAVFTLGHVLGIWYTEHLPLETNAKSDLLGAVKILFNDSVYDYASRRIEEFDDNDFHQDIPKEFRVYFQSLIQHQEMNQ